jgi:membrane protease YdiL (CAAX protease family)
MAIHTSTPPAPASGHTTAHAGPADAISRPPSLRPVRTFALVALPLGWAILSVPLLLGLPVDPFVLPTVLLALLVPAVLITRREAGGAGVRALLRDAVRLPRPAWWGLAAVTVIPAMTWIAAATLGAALPFSTDLVVTYLVDLVVAAMLVNIWEETVWTGFAQRRLAARWGAVRGSAATAALFAGIHLPLAFQGRITATTVLLGVAVLFATAIGLRLIIAFADGWSAGSLLTIGLLHASFNGAADLIDAGHDWVRLTVTVAIGLTLAVFAGWRRRSRPTP